MNTPHPTRGHALLGNSYMLYVAGLIIGLTLELFVHVSMLWPIVTPLGLVCMLLGSLLIVWAQHSSESINQTRLQHGAIETTHFCRGPYAFIRIPTQLGLMVMLIGFGLVIHSLPVITMTIIAFIVSKFTFMRKHERYLEEKYGEVYLFYKRRLKL